LRMPSRRAVQIGVIGAGPAGLATALSLTALGLHVAVVAPPHDPAPSRDTRTTALLNSSVALLENLGVWDHCRQAAAPLRAIRIVDDRPGIIRAPEVLFSASELGLESFGHNVPNFDLAVALHRAAEGVPNIWRLVTSAVTRVTPQDTAVRLDLAEGTSLNVALAVAADGRNSRTRAGAGIDVRTWVYPQSAIAATFHHAGAHDAITTELHGASGPLTVVPLPGDASSLVWVEQPEAAQTIAALDDPAFADALEQRLRGLLGTIREPSRRVRFPLSGLTAECMGGHRVALVGEAAHVMPPIGAQGLNLGLRDACVLAECVADASARGEDVGAPAVLRLYHEKRQADVMSRSVAVDALNRSLLVDLLPVQALRGVGLHALANLPFLRRLIMQAGMSSPGGLPRLMRPGGLV
jgi:2-octaprenyl-6-methoxyphenol hydroxylase